MNLSKIMKQKRDAEDRLRNRSPQTVFVENSSGEQSFNNMGNFAFKNHNHDTAYADIGHTHDTVYADIDHTHEDLENAISDVVAMIAEQCIVTLSTNDSQSISNQIITLTNVTDETTDTYMLLTGETAHTFRIEKNKVYKISVNAKYGYTTPAETSEFMSAAGNIRNVYMQYINAEIYESNMIQFFAIPGASGKIRLKIEKPIDSTGVMIRWKSTSWVSGDTITNGTLVADITDDSNYKDINEWYEVTGLTDGTPYYFKAFPYANTIYNEAIGNNETVCKAGGLLIEYTMDSVSGTTITDTSGNGINGTATNITYLTGKVGNGKTGGETSLIHKISFAAQSTAKAMSALFKTSSAVYSSQILTNTGASGDLQIAFDFSKSNRLACRTSGSTMLYYDDITVTSNSDWKHLVLNDEGTNVMRAILDNTKSSATKSLSLAVFGNIGRYGTSEANYNSTYLDQFRLYSRMLEDYEVSNLYNGGAGC